MTRDCQRWEPLLLDYLYDLLDAEEAQALKAHLEGCALCRHGLGQAKQQQKLIAAAARKEFPTVRFEPPREAVPSKPEAAVVVGMPKAGRAWDWKPWAVAAGILLVASIVAPPAYFLLRDRHHPEPALVLQPAEGNLVVAKSQSHPGSVGSRQVGAQDQALSAQQDAAQQPTRLQTFGLAEAPGHNRLEYPWVVHLTTNKAAYRPGETVHFRAVAFDSLSLRPVEAEAMSWMASITDPTGHNLAVQEKQAPQRQADAEESRALSDFAFGSWPIPAQAVPGPYRLQIHEDNQRFAADAVTFEVGTSWADQAASDRGKSARSLDGLVELYPEGGRFVAGVPNRVYYRMTGSLTASAHRNESDRLDQSDRRNDSAPSKTKEMTREAGTVRLVDGQGRVVIAGDQLLRSQAESGLVGWGQFTFVPQIGERYRLEIEHPNQGRQVSPWLDAEPSGVVLHVVESVLDQGSAIPIRVVSVGRDRLLRITAECRSRLIGQTEVIVQPGVETPVELVPRFPVAGACRLTVWEQVTAPTEWIPSAERLVFFRPRNRLKLEIKADTSGVDPAASLALNLRAVDEKGQSVPSTWTISVRTATKAEARIEAAPSLPTKLYLGPEIVAEDLPLAESLWDRLGQSSHALDLLLGTQPVRFRSVPARVHGDMLAGRDRAAVSPSVGGERELRKADERRGQNAGPSLTGAGFAKESVDAAGPQAPDLPGAAGAKGLTKKEASGVPPIAAEKAESVQAKPGLGGAGLVPGRPAPLAPKESQKQTSSINDAVPSAPGAAEAGLRRSAPTFQGARQGALGTSLSQEHLILWEPLLNLPDGTGRIRLGPIPPGTELEITAEAFTAEGLAASRTVRLAVPKPMSTP
ncbi:MAG: MG2 domain-containing protein [Gemmatales bacterium]|nr:MG2 domain-containing protein [Gemmatales bacterium]MDW8387033.1 MG2 domain-containing protein [Gemmatales bacterium]